MLSFNRIPHNIKKGFHVGVLFQVAEQFQQKETDRVIGKAEGLICVSYNGADKGEIYQGRDKSGKPANNPAIRVDFDIPALVIVF